MKVILTGGGTGGHLYPGLAIAQELQKHDAHVEILFVGTPRGIETRVVPEQGYRLRTVDVRGLPRRVSFAAVAAVWYLVKSMIQTWRIIREERPDIVVGTGGYASGPMVMVAHRRGIPCILQEQNSFPGITNRWLSRYARRIHTAYSEATPYLRSTTEVIRETGNPVMIRTSGMSRKEACTLLGLDTTRPVVFVMGGSQGARSLNSAMQDAIKLLRDAPFQLLWQCGTSNQKILTKQIQPCPTNVVLKGYIGTMEAAYTAASLVVARAGAMSLAELALFGVPAILIPLPTAAGDHQRKNATACTHAGAAVMLEDSEVDGEKLAATIMHLFKDTVALNTMSDAMKTLARPAAARAVVTSIYEIVKNN